MLNTKFDLYQTEWLDLVFDKRNKAYGAYNLRQHYSGNMVKAMAIAFTFVVAAALFMSFMLKQPAVTHADKTTVVELPPLQPPPVTPPAKEPEPVKPQAPVKASPPVATNQFLPPVVSSEPVVDDPPKNIDLASKAVGQTTSAGTDPGNGGNAPVASPSGGGGAVAAPSNEPVSRDLLEVQPEPIGGMGAFAKFLGKTLRFPSAAEDAGVQGRVIVSFVIERDGSLSNITIVKGAGYGFDEEAMRALKLAKAWKPGIQNGQPVRVRYNIPINFSLPE